MTLGDVLQRHAASAVVAAAVISEAVMTQLRGPAAEVAVGAAVVAGGLWAVHGRGRQKSAIEMGPMAQSLTWQAYTGARPRPSDTDAYRDLVARMRETTEHVRSTTAQRGLEKVTLAASSEPGSLKEARSTGHGRRGHVWLGIRWFYSPHTAHLAAVLEHELAHLQRRDTGKRIAAESAAIAAVALAAGLMPVPAFVLTGLFFWWGELACDLAAIRVCGRAAVADMWREDLAHERTRALLPRAWATVRGLRTHPPLRLRIMWAEHAPLPHTLTEPAHPLHTSVSG
ncbi:hypothetical protein AB0F20_29885 [Streptomyces goshikiensis]|uniref:hypothetical protein n=1 Tax=Streptomyces goshikiensis TaxID=1942 RepID=UPI0033E270EC